jgi:hypothetical protein
VRVLIVGSCGKRKLHNSPKQPKCQDIDSNSGIDKWVQRFSKRSVPARDMYTGPQSIELMKAVDLLRTIPTIEVQFVIISAGFGIKQEDDLIPPYDCSFTSMKIAEVRKRSNELKLTTSFTNLTNNGFNLIYLALGKRYLASLGTDALSMLQTPTVAFHGPESDYLIRLPTWSYGVQGRFTQNLDSICYREN